MAPLSSRESTELPDSTHPGNILTRSFFRRRGNRLAPPPHPSEPPPLPKSEWELPPESECGLRRVATTPEAERDRRAQASQRQPSPCGASAPPPDRQQPMGGSCRRPLRTARTLPCSGRCRPSTPTEFPWRPRLGPGGLAALPWRQVPGWGSEAPAHR